MTGKRKRGRPKVDSKLDNWSGVQDLRERKRIQDRLAQRARRDRLVANKSKTPEAVSEASDNPVGISNETSPERSPEAKSNQSCVDLIPVSPQSTHRIDFHAFACAGVPAMRSHHLRCSLSGMSIYLALGRHALVQGTICSACDENAPSPIEYLSLPDSLKPTPLQLVKPHRKWIDRFPFPRMRDNLILLSEILDLDDFVRDLFGMSSLIFRHESGQATWDPGAWIIAPEFASKWGYLFR
ncbi:hypothetical protein LTR10_018480 [Elasticomyces elasticus]|uniref:BZIP domain-containing protein n=1 Tax=Exophiala sideris TaxID=1016849 RepID=A0ABR0J0P4_9EURO|nr:hypothetical protein LTR10_018480 [Elasticomyces elasticus]KAK5023929.1 hypothetical protein LTS07_009055 [Exophiala sideris]KAK5030055.1 hypothetical protein LTR13_008367 [Exophiala sideris]KAK5053550.1 hypothetical protein LTR69_009194 [Exophiala sideris]KAK5179409.1 hypothetical protein LTR44_008248 [Eurotiomycetes sp. CCFEE 6388]